MAVTSIATSHDLTQEQWEAKLYKKYQEQTFFGKFKGVGQGSIVQVKRQLEKVAGDAITFGLSDSIRGTAGVTGNTPLEGHDGSNYVVNNEEMVFHDQRVVIDQIRQSVKIAGKMDEKRVAFNMREEAKDKLTDWMAYNEDQSLFNAINTADEVGGTGSTLDTLFGTTHSTLTYDSIVDMKKEVMFPTTNNVTGGSATTRKLEPIRVSGGEEVFVLGVNPADAANFRKSTDFKNFNQNADVRGDKNAIFTGMLGMFNNVIIHEHSSFVAGSPVLMGANALFLAYGKEIMYGEKMFDYDNQVGFMIGSIRGTSLAKFTNEAGTAQGSHGAVKFKLY
jgi:N4-gp56 family major capsid protein